MTDTRRKATPPRQITNSSVPKGQHYIPEWVPVRPGAQDHEAVPALHCGTRYYRDGREVKA